MIFEYLCIIDNCVPIFERCYKQLIIRIYGQEKVEKQSFRWEDLNYTTLHNQLSAERKRTLGANAPRNCRARHNSTDAEFELRLKQYSSVEIQELLERCAINIPDRENVEVP